MEVAISVVSALFGAAGLVVAALQRSERQKLEGLLRARSWHNFFRADNALETSRLALKSYKDTHRDQIDPTVLELLARAESLASEISSDAVNSIHVSEKSFTRADIDRWKNENRISEEAAAFFHRVVPSPPSSSQPKNNS
jgi:hypothetical protein